MEHTLRILLMLSGMLDGARREDIATEALPLLLAATGSAGGAVYLKREGALELVAASGLPCDVRGPLSRLDLAGPAWFVAQRAAMDRALAVAREPMDEGHGPLAPGALASAGWGTIAAYPIMMKGTLLGVVVIAAPVGEEMPYDALMALELGCNTLAVYLSAHGGIGSAGVTGAARVAGVTGVAGVTEVVGSGPATLPRVTGSEEPTLPGVAVIALPG